MNNESGFKPEDTLAEKIEIMKAEGRQYSQEAFQQLLSAVNKSGQVDIQLSDNVFDKRERLLDIIGNLDTKDQEHIAPALLRQLEEIAPVSEDMISGH